MAVRPGGRPPGTDESGPEGCRFRTPGMILPGPAYTPSRGARRRAHSHRICAATRSTEWRIQGPDRPPETAPAGGPRSNPSVLPPWGQRLDGLGARSCVPPTLPWWQIPCPRPRLDGHLETPAGWPGSLGPSGPGNEARALMPPCVAPPFHPLIRGTGRGLPLPSGPCRRPGFRSPIPQLWTVPPGHGTASRSLGFPPSPTSGSNRPIAQIGRPAPIQLLSTCGHFTTGWRPFIRV